MAGLFTEGDLSRVITVDPALPEPVFWQLKRQITSQRLSGELPGGHRLPPVRHLAQELGIAPNTVARAYRELEAEGIIETRGRAGSFVTGTAAGADRAGLAAARAFVAEVERLGFPRTQAHVLVERVLREG